MKRWTSRTLPVALAAALTAFAAPSAEAADLSGVSATDYHAAAYFQTAQDDPRLKDKSRQAQIKAVAKDMRMKPKALEAALEKVDALGEDPVALAKGALEKAFEARPRLKGRVLDVLINSENSKHVVLYVRFRASSYRDVVKEASALAYVVKTEAPLISTLSLSAIHPKAPADNTQSVWSGKIGADAMERIQENRIDDYADRLYKRLFEGVTERPF